MTTNKITATKCLIWSLLFLILVIIGHLRPYFALQGRDVLGRLNVQTHEQMRYRLNHERAAVNMDIAGLPEKHPTSDNSKLNEGK